MKTFKNIANENQTVANTVYSLLNSEGKKIFNSVFNTNKFWDFAGDFDYFMRIDIEKFDKVIKNYDGCSNMPYDIDAYFYVMIAVIYMYRKNLISDDATVVKTWYRKTFKNDELGKEINKNLTFEMVYALNEAVLSSWSYNFIPADSVVRENIFSKVSELFNTKINF